MCLPSASTGGSAPLSAVCFSFISRTECEVYCYHQHLTDIEAEAWRTFPKPHCQRMTVRTPSTCRHSTDRQDYTWNPRDQRSGTPGSAFHIYHDLKSFSSCALTSDSFSYPGWELPCSVFPPSPGPASSSPQISPVPHHIFNLPFSFLDLLPMYLKPPLALLTPDLGDTHCAIPGHSHGCDLLQTLFYNCLPESQTLSLRVLIGINPSVHK